MNIYSEMKESEIKKHIEKRLQGYMQVKKLLYIRTNSGNIWAGKYRIKLAPIGCSDLIIFLPGGKVLFVEIKDIKGKQSPGQIKFQEDIETLGFRYFIVKSMEDLENALKQND